MRKNIKNPKPTPRDLAILQGLLDYGVLDWWLIQLLYFPRSFATMRKQANPLSPNIRRSFPVSTTVSLRLDILVNMGLIQQSNRQQTAVARGRRLVWINRVGVAKLAEQSGLIVSDFPWHKPGARISQVDHDLWANTLRAYIEQSLAKHPDFDLKEWLSGRLLAAAPDTVEFEIAMGSKEIKKKRRIIPDGFFVISQVGEEDRPSRFLVEVDNSTHSLARIAREKLHAGLAYISSPEYKQRFDDNRGRWLFLMESERRMRNLQETAVRELGKGAAAFYFTSFEKMMNNNILTDPIWFLGGASTTPQSLEYAIRNRA